MPRPNARQRRRLKAKAIGVTASLDAFSWVMQFKRINILVEGDSWFAYPKEWLVFGPNSNLANHIFAPLVNRALVNTLCLASNGDTAKKMLSGKQEAYLKKVLKKHGDKLDLMLFSAGGNDVVGPKDLKPLLNDHQPGFDEFDCINRVNFDARLADIVSRYERLLALRDKHAPQMQIFCHTYDFIHPSDAPAEFLWGIEVTGPWIKPTLQKKGISDEMGGAVIRQMLLEFAAKLKNLNHPGFHVVDTQNTLTPGKSTDWLNEIHPTPSGFKRIARKVYATMREQFPELPAFN